MNKKAWLTVAGIGLLAAAGCRSSTSSSGGAGASGGTSSGGSSAGGAGGMQVGGANSGGATPGGTGGTSAGATGGTNTGGTNTGGTTGVCTGQDATVSQLTDGTVGTGITVKLTGVVATSQKFLVYGPGNSGSCLWGVFVAESGNATAEPGKGIMVVSYGDGALTGAGGAGSFEPCVSGSDAIPDNVAPGDLFDIVGDVDAYAPSTCTAPAPAKQLQVRVSQGCPLGSVGTTTPLTPAVITTAQANDIATGTDLAVLNQWGGVLARVETVTGVQDGTNNSIVGAFGVIKLNETNIEVHDKIYYYDLSGTGPKDPAKGPIFGFPTSFNRIDGLVYLDYCTWSLNPRDKCTDHDPPSEDCP